MKTHAKVYRGFRFPGEIISHGMWLYLQFSLGLHDVEEILAKRGTTAYCVNAEKGRSPSPP